MGIQFDRQRFHPARPIMKTWVKFAVLAVVIIAAAISVVWADRTINRLTAERDKYRNNTETLLTDVETYRVRDSLNAARVQSMELTLKEFQRYRVEDAALIQSLKCKNRDLAAVNKTQTETIIQLSAIGKDTVLIRDSVPMPAISFHCGDTWYNFDGVLADGELSGTLECRDSLVLVETVQYKRFLGFLWRTNKVKNRQLDCVSKSPHNSIKGLEYVVIEK